MSNYQYTPFVPTVYGMSAAVSPIPQATAFPEADTFSIIGNHMPGKWTLLSADKEYGWEIRVGNLQSGAVVVPKGDPLVVARFKGEFWSNVDVAAFKIIRKIVYQKGAFDTGGGLISGAMGIDHPELQALGVTSVVIQKITPLIQAEAGLWVTTIDFLQYRPPQKAQPKPTQKIPDVPPAKPTAKNDQERELQGLQLKAATKLGQF